MNIIRKSDPLFKHLFDVEIPDLVSRSIDRDNRNTGNHTITYIWISEPEIIKGRWSTNDYEGKLINIHTLYREN